MFLFKFVRPGLKCSIVEGGTLVASFACTNALFAVWTYGKCLTSLAAPQRLSGVKKVPA